MLRRIMTMTNTYLKTVEEMFEDLGGFTPDKMQALIGETMEYFTDLQARFGSEDAEVREKALNMAKEVQKGLEKQIESICKKAGFEPSELASVISAQVGAPQADLLSEAEKRFSTVFGEQEAPTEVKKARKSNKIKLVG